MMLPVPDEEDPLHAPRGRDRHLRQALVELAGDADLDDEDREDAEAKIVALATRFNQECAWQEAGTRVHSVIEELREIEDAASRLAAAFNAASLETLLALHGFGVGGVRRLFSQPEQARRYEALILLSGRYHLPFGRPDGAMDLEAMLAVPVGHNHADDAQGLEWPVAAEALSESAGMRRKQFTADIHLERERFDEVLHRGPDGDLGEIGKRRAVARRPPHNDPSTTPDRGGRQSVSDWTRGPPKWILARDCYELVAQYQPHTELTGVREGRLYRFTLEVYALATGEDTREVETPGDAYDAGMGRHVKNAARICAARAEVNMNRRQADPFAPLSNGDPKKRISLDYAYQCGRVPDWLLETARGRKRSLTAGPMETAPR